MAEHELMSAMNDLRELIEPHCAASSNEGGRFEQLMAVLTDVDFQMCDDRDQRVYKRMKSV